MSGRAKLLIGALLLLIVVAHVGLWRDPDIPLQAKRRLTILNALGWAAILLPAWGVSLWLKARTGQFRRADRNSAPED